MKRNKTPKTQYCGLSLASFPKNGFALVVTLSLMILLVIIAVGLLTLSSISLRGSAAQDAMATARANARMALILAIGELQKQAGPDQRVTMTSDLQSGAAPANPNWTGTTDVSPANLTPDAKSAKINWLVSGETPDPTKKLTKSSKMGTGDALSLGTFMTSSTGTATATTELLAPVVNITEGNKQNRFAWWIGDEGTKARVDMAKPKIAPTTDKDRLAQSQSPLEYGWKNLGATWDSFAPFPDGKIDKTGLISMQTTSLAAASKTLASEYFNDVTTGGYGLPTNVVTGGMKPDLSLVFDKSQQTKKFGETYFGATPVATTLGGAPVTNFTVKTPSKFYLSDVISKGGTIGTGPNWGILWNYANLWQNVASQKATMVGINPLVKTDVRFKDWLPYTNSDRSGGDANNWRKDEQHTNSGLTPVIALLQMGFRFSSEKAPKEKPTDPVYYKAQITMQPVVGIWNPYNVAIKSMAYRFDWALYPYFRFNYAKSLGNGKFTDSKFTELWLREAWIENPKDPNDFIPSDSNPKIASLFRLETEQIDLQPGEFRLFSSVDKSMVKPNSGTLKPHKLKAGWSEKGGFVVNLKDKDGKERLVPAGHRAWFGDIVLQDVQSTETKKRWPMLDITKLAAGYVVLKSLDNTGKETVIYRATELWNGINTSGLKVPEPVVSGSTGGVDTTKTTYLIDDLEGDKVLAHIATWSFFNRTTLQVEEADQRLRGWVDSNPRSISSNPAWDGSSVATDGSKRTGWHTTSQFLGIYNPPGKPKQVGDGKGGNRGLLAEGGSAIPEPEVSKAGGRYQGFGGAANTLAGGKTNVIVYDVPRSPLVSIGQFQHAQLARYNFEPGFVVGNSYANPRIPLSSTLNSNFSGVSGLNISDVSYDVNKKLWDGYFFSTLGLDYVSSSGTSFDKAFDLKKLASGQTSLPNPRMQFSPLPGDTSIDKIIADNGDRAPEAISSRLLVKGAFNVNSTSKTAWKAVLSSMGASQLPVVNPQNNTVSWKNPNGIRFNRFGTVINDKAYEKGGAGDEDGYWKGWRNISDTDLDKLAEEIVSEVKARGPFRSMAEFVNRNPNSSTMNHQLKGPLQAALDKTINVGLPTSIGKTATNPTGSQFSKPVTNENQSSGSASYLMQGDVLQSLAPILQVRSDYFKIRTCGEALDAGGNVIARAWCEAYVQRTSDYADPEDKSHTIAANLTSAINKNFGRRFHVVSFRWLPSTEI
jgi:hypothetical protein